MDIEQVNLVTPILYENGYRILQTYRFGVDEESHAEKLLEWMAPKQGAHIIDLGCGVGEIARIFKTKRHDLSFSLVNISQVQLSYCPSDADLVLSDFRSVPRKSASYDCATFMFSLGHESAAEGLREACRLLKDGGDLFIFDMERLDGDGAYMAESVEYQVRSRDELRDDLLAAGFVEIECFVPEVIGNVGPDVCGSDGDYEKIFAGVQPVIWKLRKKSAVERHKNIVLQFSGGKDSLACLMLMKDQLHRITVLWTNTGAAFPETIEQMAAVKAMCQNFVEANGHQPEHLEANGWPVDVLPVRNHLQSQYLTQQKRLPLQGFLGCCMTNMMKPMHDATLALGATLIIRGQKLADHHKSPVKSGDVIDGVEYWFPIEDWDDEQVLDFVGDSPLLPAHYSDARTSLDCWSCTAYLGENQWKLPYLEKHHPEKAKEVKRRLIMIRNEISADMIHLEGLCNG